MSACCRTGTHVLACTEGQGTPLTVQRCPALRLRQPPAPSRCDSRAGGVDAEAAAVHLRRLLGHLAQHRVELRPREHGADEHAAEGGRRGRLAREPPCCPAARQPLDGPASRRQAERAGSTPAAHPGMHGAGPRTSGSSRPRARRAAPGCPPPWSPTPPAPEQAPGQRGSREALRAAPHPWLTRSQPAWYCVRHALPCSRWRPSSNARGRQAAVARKAPHAHARAHLGHRQCKLAAIVALLGAVAAVHCRRLLHVLRPAAAAPLLLRQRRCRCLPPRAGRRLQPCGAGARLPRGHGVQFVLALWRAGAGWRAQAAGPCRALPQAAGTMAAFTCMH